MVEWWWDLIRFKLDLIYVTIYIINNKENQLILHNMDAENFISLLTRIFAEIEHRNMNFSFESFYVQFLAHEKKIKWKWKILMIYSSCLSEAALMKI